ncbi:hypothetical protein VTO42DRAFT_5787 [Malbranchea cinnamomea]
MSSTSIDDDYSPEYNEKYPNFPLDRLQVPPPEWELYDIPDKTHLRNRALDLATFKKLVRHHTWGFDVVIGERKTKDRLLQVLKRIVYNQEPHLRPTWHEFVSRKCDAGPRLLKRSYNALRISRRFPDGVPGQPLRWGGNGSGSQSQQCQQGQLARQQPRGGGFGMPMLPGELQSVFTPPVSVGSVPNRGVVPQIPCSLWGKGLPGTCAGSPGIDAASVTPDLPSTMMPAYIYDQEPPPAKSPAAGPGPTRILTPVQICMPTPPQAHATMPAVQSSPTSRSRTGYNPLTATRGQISHLRLSISGDIPRFTFDPNGSYFPYRGRGPASKGLSDAIDCAIVVGRLLNLSTTASTIDISGVEQAYLDALSVNWDVLSDNQSAERAQEFRNCVGEYMNASGKDFLSPLGTINVNSSPSPLTPANVWKLCTRSLSLAQLRYLESVQGCSCQCGTSTRMKKSTRAVSTPYITTDALDAGDLDSSISRFFAYERMTICQHCGAADSVIVRRRFEQLPLHLVIRPDPRVCFASHSADRIELDYMDTHTGAVWKAGYRWLGGIYPVPADQIQNPQPQRHYPSPSSSSLGRYYQQSQQTAFKVLWTDAARGEVDTGALRVYDAGQVSGAIVGGVQLNQLNPNQGRGERVPAKWWAQAGVTPLLFYEKVDVELSAPADVASGVFGSPPSDSQGPPQIQASASRGTISKARSNVMPARTQMTASPSRVGSELPKRVRPCESREISRQLPQHGPGPQLVNTAQASPSPAPVPAASSSPWSSSPLRAEVDFKPGSGTRTQQESSSSGRELDDGILSAQSQTGNADRAPSTADKTSSFSSLGSGIVGMRQESVTAGVATASEARGRQAQRQSLRTTPSPTFMAMDMDIALGLIPTTLGLGLDSIPLGHPTTSSAPPPDQAKTEGAGAGVAAGQVSSEATIPAPHGQHPLSSPAFPSPPPATAVPGSDLNWALDLLGATQTFHVPTNAECSGSIAGAGSGAGSGTLDLGLEYNAFDVSFDLLNNSANATTTNPATGTPSTATVLLPSPSVPVVGTTSASTGGNASSVCVEPTMQNSYCAQPTNMTAASRKRSLSFSSETASGHASEHKRAKM